MIVEPTELIQGILDGKVPTPTKEDLRIAAKRQRDRERYAKQTNRNWKKHDPKSSTLDTYNVLGVDSVNETNRRVFLGESR